MRTERSRLARSAIAIFLAVQIALPLIALAGPRPGRLGWQMFSASLPMPRVWVEHVDGSLEEIDLGPRLAYGRPEIDLESAARRTFCFDRSAVAVIVQRGSDQERLPCV